MVGGRSESTSPSTTPIKETEAVSGVSDSDPFSGEDDIHLTVLTSDSTFVSTRILCKEFIALYPEKSIEIDVQSKQEYDSVIAVMNSPKNSADIFSFASDSFDSLTESGLLSPAEDQSGILGRNSSNSVTAATYQGKIYAYPYACSTTPYLVYDRKYVSDDDAQTLEGVLAACRKAGKSFVVDCSNSFFSCMFLFTGGLIPNGLDSDGKQMFIDYNEDQVAETLYAFEQLIDEYRDVIVNGDVSRISAGSGASDGAQTVAAGIDGSWNYTDCREALNDDLGAAKLPTVNVSGKDTQIVPLMGYKFYGVNTYTKYPKAAHLLADYLTDEYAQTERAKAADCTPTNKSAAEDPEIADVPFYSAMSYQSSFAVIYEYISPTFWSPVGSMGSSIYNNEYSKKELSAALEKTISNIKK